MSMVRNLVVGGVAKKLYDVARKPENQQKFKELVGQLASRAGAQTRGGTAGRR
jgi:hypothetical protein